MLEGRKETDGAADGTAVSERVPSQRIINKIAKRNAARFFNFGMIGVMLYTGVLGWELDERVLLSSDYRS